MNCIMQWCNDNAGVIAVIGIAISIVLVVVPALFKFIPKCVKHIQQKNQKEKDDAHKADIEAVVRHLNAHVVVTPKTLADALDKSEEDIQELLSELIDRGIVGPACNNCELSDPNSVWELKR